MRPLLRRSFIGGLGLFGLLGGAAFMLAPTQVPPEAIRTSVIRTEATVDRAWELPVATTFKRNVDWQSNRSLCGPASVANVLRSLGEEETTEDQVLEDTGLCWSGVCFFGLTLDELAEVTDAHTERQVTVLRDVTEEDFLEHLRLSNDPGRRYIINFTRERIFGAGGGHHSPIGGYLQDEDLVFVLDVNEDFQPWLIERSRLFAAMDTFDGEKKRGLLLID